jgi:hypothetical protein
MIRQTDRRLRALAKQPTGAALQPAAAALGMAIAPFKIGCPVSSRDLRFERIRGHPPETV